MPCARFLGRKSQAAVLLLALAAALDTAAPALARAAGLGPHVAARHLADLALTGACYQVRTRCHHLLPVVAGPVPQQPI